MTLFDPAVSTGAVSTGTHATLRVIVHVSNLRLRLFTNRTDDLRRVHIVEYKTKFGSLASFDKGSIEVIDDEPKHYAFSNIFEVASHAKPWEKVAVGKNMQYVLEAIRAEGTSEWRTCAHDEFPLVMDGEVIVELVKLDTPLAAADKEGSIAITGEPVGKKMGRITLRRGHQALLPANAAYRMSAAAPSVVLLQTILGDDTVEKWSEICFS